MKNYISLLCKFPTKQSIKLYNHLEQKKFTVTMIVDKSNSKYETLKNNKYYGLTKIFRDKPTSWEYSIYNIDKNKLYNLYDYFYFIEDDVYSHSLDTYSETMDLWSTFNQDLIACDINTMQEKPEWFWWKSITNYCYITDSPVKSYNPICRISSRLIKIIIDSFYTHNTFYFHEILFASLCTKNGMSYIDYRKNNTLKKSFHIFRAYPIIDINEILYSNKLYHPFKYVFDEPV